MHKNNDRLSWRQALAAYRGPLMARIFLLGALSGFPWVLIGAMLTLWLSEAGIQRSGVGLFGLVFVAYALNLLWAPLVDAFPGPGAHRGPGRRRGWILTMQGIILVFLVALSLLEPAEHLYLIALGALGIALAGATQDVVIDALRIEMVAASDPEKMAAGAAVTTAGWWASYGFGGALAFYLVDRLEPFLSGNHWQVVYLLQGVLIALGMLLLYLFVPEPEDRRKPAPAGADGIFLPALRLYLQPVLAFLGRYGLRIGLAILGVVLLFKVGEAFLGRMSLLFYREIGFSRSEIALYAKVPGTLTYVLFALLGGIFSARYGLLRAIFLGGLAMAGTNLLFAVLAWHPVAWLFALAVVADQFTTAVSTVAFVAFISQLCDKVYAATQYAALASLGNLGRTTLAASAGFVVDGLDGNWGLFFILTALMVLPSLALLLAVRKRIAPALAGGAVRF